MIMLRIRPVLFSDTTRAPSIPALRCRDPLCAAHYWSSWRPRRLVANCGDIGMFFRFHAFWSEHQRLGLLLGCWNFQHFRRLGGQLVWCSVQIGLGIETSDGLSFSFADAEVSLGYPPLFCLWCESISRTEERHGAEWHRLSKHLTRNINDNPGRQWRHATGE